ncbi:hypothetical protein HYX16_04190 [Candidatus Woesearchaeota archaeon]|nr:hypothetical protein [Candidatus Woesearchaeota archaeon]
MKKTIFLTICLFLLAVNYVLAEQADTNVTVNNVAPTVDFVSITPDDDGATAGVQVNANPGGTKTVTVTAEVSDANEQSDISIVKAFIIGPSFISESPVTLSCNPVDLDTTSCSGQFDLNYTNSAGNYVVSVQATDVGLFYGATNATFTYVSQLAILFDASSINFNNLNPGTIKTVDGDFNLATADKPTVKNVGNTQVDLNVRGTDLTKGAKTIPVGNLRYRFGSSAYAQLSTTNTANDINLLSGNLIDMDLELTTPSVLSPGNYKGTITLAPV